MSINAPRRFNLPNVPHTLPSFTTVELTVPSAASCAAPANRTSPSPTGKPSTCCSYEIPDHKCSSKPGYSTVSCKTASDCGKKVQEPLSGCTCDGKAVQCVHGICTNPDAHTPGGGDLCATGQGGPGGSSATLDGGLGKIAMLSRFAALSVSLTQKASLFQGRQVLGGRHTASADDREHDA